MNRRAHLSYRVKADGLDDFAQGFAELSVLDQRRLLLEVIDKNHLYVPYSELDDKDHGVSEEDKRLNHMFYGA